MEDEPREGDRMEENIAEDIVNNDELLASMPSEEGEEEMATEDERAAEDLLRDEEGTIQKGGRR